MDLLKRIEEKTSENDFKNDLVDFLSDICLIDTSLLQDLKKLRQNEHNVFELILKKFDEMKYVKGRIEKKPIPFHIQDHPSFTNPFYALSGKGERKSLSEVYENRYNLLLFIDGEHSPKGRNIALNAHIDVVVPFFPPEKKGDFIYGRGTADDKGNVAAVLGALSVLNNLVHLDGLILKNSITMMFVIDEEMGGNGSLALCMDDKVMRRCDTLLILECTNLGIHPANRGAVNFKLMTGFRVHEAGDSPLSLTESLVYGILEMEKEGDSIREESVHPLFPHRPVQTCLGILGNYGDHPSTICGELEFVLTGIDTKPDRQAAAGILRRGLSRYIRKYGDKTKTRDAVTGEKKVKRHMTLRENSRGKAILKIYGATGHMGSAKENDSAIMKWAYMARELIEERLQGKVNFSMHLPENGSYDPLILEGTQGFLPTHDIEIIKKRITDALQRGAGHYLNLMKADYNDIFCKVTFDKLHNNAFESAIYPETMNRLRKAASDTGIMEINQTLRGWDVSCDARLFAEGNPQSSVITCGTGSLEFAHSNSERIYIPDLMKFIRFLTYFMILETGSLNIAKTLNRIR